MMKLWFMTEAKIELLYLKILYHLKTS